MAEIPADAFGPDGITDADRAAIAEDNLSAALMQRDEAYAAGVAAGRTAATADLRQRIQRVWPDPMGQWSAEQADAGRAVKEAMLRATGTQESV